MITEQIPAVQQLTLEQKWMLANELWIEVQEQQQKLPSSLEVLALVEQRLVEHEREPSAAMQLEVFKRRHRLP